MVIKISMIDTFSKMTEFGHYFILEQLKDLFDNLLISTWAQDMQTFLQKRYVFQIPDEVLPMETT